MRRFFTVFMVLVLLSVASTSFGAGFALLEQSVKGLGNAFAGGAAIAEDSTTIFFNPAGMSRLEGMQATAGLHYIIPSAKFTTTAATNPAAGDISADPNGGQGGKSAIVPNFYFSAKAGGKLNYGVGINTPFGLATKYDQNWVGRYHAIESDLKTVNINPSVAYKVSDQLSLGLGVSAQYLDVVLSQAAFTGGPDAHVEVNGDSWGYGFNLGALYQVTDDTRIGASYRSSVFHSIDDGSFVAGAPVGVTGTASGKIRLPASAQLSVFHQVNGQFDVMADIMWTEWSTFEQLIFSTPLGVNVTDEYWDDNFRYSVGATYRPNDTCSLRAGVAYDETPIPDATRTPRIPGNDRVWFSIGAGHKMDNLNLDIGYTYLIVEDGSVNLVDASRGNLSGSFENGVNIVSVEASYVF